MRESLKSYFNLTRGERNASIILIALIILTAVYPLVDASLVKPYQADFSEFKRYVASLDKDSIKASDTLGIESYAPGARQGKKKFRFDPNTSGVEELQSLGFRKYIAERIVKYRSSGGKFRRKEDLLKIYGIDQDLVKSLWNEIEVTEVKVQERAGERGEGSKPIAPAARSFIIDINNADTTALIALPGIGSKLAKRIVDFRNRLGGFYSLDQLREVYGLKPEAVDAITPKLTLDISAIRLLDINEAAFDELERHPYISRNLASAIVNYRTQHGEYRSLEDLRKIVLLDGLTLERLAHYIKL